jgi:hypothetical protein
MALLTHATNIQLLERIFKEGLRLPEETGICNWEDLSFPDRISTMFSIKRSPPKHKLTFISPLWHVGDAHIIISPEYILEHIDELKYYSSDKQELFSFAQAHGIKQTEQTNIHAPKQEVVCYNNIPVEAFSTILLNKETANQAEKIKEILPNHMNLYTRIHKLIRIYQRVD